MNKRKIFFNIPYRSKNELKFIKNALESSKIDQDKYSERAVSYLENIYRGSRVLLTTSCTDALEMCALLLRIRKGDEIIVPSYTFVTSALAFYLHGATIVFADSEKNSPNIDINEIKNLINKNTKAILVVHYAGIAAEIEKIKKIADQNGLILIEDAAQCIGSYYKGSPLGTFGDLAALSFHSTKNITCGEGGALIINNSKFVKRGEIIYEKGTNRKSFSQGMVKKYSWVDVGSSYANSEILNAMLYAQLTELEEVNKKRTKIWEIYRKNLSLLEKDGFISLPAVPEGAVHNGHIFYIVLKTKKERTELIHFLKKKNIQVFFHYVTLHDSPFYKGKYKGPKLQNAKKYSNRLLRLPLHPYLKMSDIKYICDSIKSYFK